VPLLAFALLAAGCAARVPGGEAGPRTDRFEVDGAAFRVAYRPEDESVAKDLRRLLEEVYPLARRWGELRAPVTITIHPTHEALEEAVQREGYAWLRAWARYATIDLQSPKSWSLFGADRQRFRELVLHELTHCVMYQNAATDWSWPYKGIPLWFREGLASVTAEQGYRRPRVKDLFVYYERRSPGAGDGAGGGGAGRRGVARRSSDPLSDPESLYQAESDVVYGAAHVAFEFLLARYGEERVHAILRNMSQGDAFDDGFRKAIGLRTEDFEKDFRRYVVWQGWRRGE
jgi:hypothetical protein